MFDVGMRAETIRERFRRKLAERPGKPVDGARLLRALGRRKGWIVGAVFVGILAGLGIPYGLLSFDWTSTAVLEWEKDETSAAGAVRDLRTLVDSVKLPTHLGRVREQLGLETTRNQLGESLEISFDRDSNVVAIAATADEPEMAARIANAVVDVFLAHQADLARVRSEELVAQVRTEVEQARSGLREAQDVYDSFRREHGISDLSLERQHAIELAAELQSEAELARAEALSEEARTDEIAARVASGERVVATTPALRLARQQLSEARATLSDQHPRVRALQARVRELERRAGERAAGRAASAIARRAQRASHRAGEREGTYDRLVHQARERLGQLSEVEGEASRLLSVVHVKEAALAEREGILTRAQVEATTSNSGFRLLAPALPPEQPSSSNRRAMAVFILLGSVALTVVGLLLWELRGLRAHTANEVAFWGRGAVLGASTWPAEKRSIDPLIEELGDYALESGGTTLVLAATESETALAREVAERLHLDTDLTDRFGDTPVDRGADTPVDRGADTPVDPEERPEEPIRRDIHVPPAPEVEVVDGPPEAGASSSHPIVRADHGVRAFGLTRRIGDWVPPRIAAWAGDGSGPPARRAVRVADRVIVVVTSGGISFGALERLRQSIGREDDDGVAYLVLGMRPHLAGLPDRAGPVEQFWRTRRA